MKELGEVKIPLVNGKHFPYTKSGKQAAERYAKKTGKKLTIKRK